jgi:hypothetical protein
MDHFERSGVLFDGSERIVSADRQNMRRLAGGGLLE